MNDKLSAQLNKIAELIIEKPKLVEKVIMNGSKKIDKIWSNVNNYTEIIDRILNNLKTAKIKPKSLGNKSEKALVSLMNNLDRLRDILDTTDIFFGNINDEFKILMNDKEFMQSLKNN